jgi:transposase
LTVKFLPPYSPELQPVERLWSLVDEPVANQYFETIDELESVLIKRCNILTQMKEEIKNLTDYHWLHFL